SGRARGALPSAVSGNDPRTGRNRRRGRVCRRARVTRIVPATHGVKPVTRDPDTELELSDRLRHASSRDELLQLASRHAMGETEHDAEMRRVIWRALARRFGHGVWIGRGAIASHPET